MTPRQAALSQEPWLKPKPNYKATPRPSLHSDHCMICSRILTPGGLVLGGIAKQTNSVVLVGKCCEGELKELLLCGIHNNDPACDGCTT